MSRLWALWPGGDAIFMRGTAGESVDGQGLASGRDLTGIAFTAILLLALLAGSMFRFWEIGGDPIWMDEAFTYFAASLDWRTLLLGSIDTHPPLFYAFEKLWLEIVPSPSALRVPAALFGLANIAALSLLLARIHSRRAGALAAMFLAVSSFHIWISRDARMYSLLLLALTFVLLSVCALVSGDRQRMRWLALYCVAAITALYTQVIAAPFIAGCVLSWGFACLADRERWLRLTELLVANLAVALAAIPLLVHVMGVMGAYPGSGSSDLASAVWFLSNVLGYPGLPGVAELLTKLGLAVLITVCLIVMARRPQERGMLFVIAGSGAFYGLVILLIGQLVPLFANRIFLPLLLPMTALLAVGLADASSRLLRWGAAAVLLASALASSFNTLRYEEKYDNPALGLRLANANGFADAPVVTCSIFAAMATYLADPERVIYQARQDGVVRFDSDYAGLLGRGLRWLLLEPLPALSAANPQVRDYSAEIARSPELIVLSEPCNAGYREASREGLKESGFALDRSISLATDTERKVIRQTQTVVDLYRRR